MRIFLAILAICALLTIAALPIVDAVGEVAMVQISKGIDATESWLAPTDASNSANTSSMSNSDPCPREPNCDRSTLHLSSQCAYN